MSNIEEYEFSQSNKEDSADFEDEDTDNKDQSFKRAHDNSQDENNSATVKRARKDSNVEMRCLVPSAAAGGIIGRKGENIKDMRQTFAAQIHLPDGDNFERVLRVHASIESCGEIILRILPIINDEGRRGSSGDYDSERSGPQTLRLLIHQSQAGGVIGIKGYKIKELREKTGANIKVHQDCCPNSTDRVCVVTGAPEVVSSSVVLILELLEETPPKGSVHNYDPAASAYNDDFDDYRGGRYGGGDMSRRGRGRGFGGGRRGGGGFGDRRGGGGFRGDRRGRDRY